MTLAEREPTRKAPPEETNRWLVLVLVCLAQFMVILDATITNVALPSIQEDLGFTPAGLQWVVNAYTLLFGGFLLLGGRMGDLIGRKRIFIAGVAVFSTASLLCGLSHSTGMLIAARALQGLGAALVSPAALSIITTTFEEGPDRTKALGVWSAIAAGGAAFGLLLGRRADRAARVGVDLLRQRARRHRSGPAVAALRARAEALGLDDRVDEHDQAGGHRHRARDVEGLGPVRRARLGHEAQ